MDAVVEPTELTPAQAAAIALRSEKTVLRWIAAKRLPAHRRLGRLYVWRTDLDKYLTSAPAVPEPVAAVG
jgi:excisionase family DNA binding protein